MHVYSTCTSVSCHYNLSYLTYIIILVSQANHTFINKNTLSSVVENDVIPIELSLVSSYSSCLNNRLLHSLSFYLLSLCNTLGY